jgi:hypothetical protein
MLLGYFLNIFDMGPIAAIITDVYYYCYYYIKIWLNGAAYYSR